MPTVTEMLEEIADMSAGLGVLLLPMLLLAMPGILLVVVPAIILMAPLALAGVVLAAPFLIVRSMRT